MRILDDIFEMASGYMLDFSNKTLSEFFEDELGIDIYDEKYALNGDSEAKRVRAFIESEDGCIVGQLLRTLWHHRNSYGDRPAHELEPGEKRLFVIVTRIETGAAPPTLTRLSGVAQTLNFDAVYRDVKRALDTAHYPAKKTAIW